MKKKKFTAAVLGTSILLSSGIGVFAGAQLQEIKAYLNPAIQFKVNGTPTQLTNSSGAAIAPISYQDTTYLPVRAVSDALGVAVHFEQETQTISLGERSEGVALASNFSDMYHTKDPDKTSYMGTDYKEVYFNAAGSNRSVGFMLYPKKQYQSLYIQVASIGGDIEKLSFKDSKNDVELRQAPVKSEDGLTWIEVEIGGVEEIYVSGSVDKNTTVFIPLLDSYYK